MTEQVLLPLLVLTREVQSGALRAVGRDGRLAWLLLLGECDSRGVFDFERFAAVLALWLGTGRQEAWEVLGKLAELGVLQFFEQYRSPYGYLIGFEHLLVEGPPRYPPPPASAA